MSAYTPGEIMVTAAARRINDGDVVFVGMRLPLLAFMLAKQTHAPRALGLFENGVLRDHPAAAPIITMGDAPNQAGALRLCGLDEVMSLLSGGRVDLGFIGGAQVDQWGNVNTHRAIKPDGGNGAPARLRRRGGHRLPGPSPADHHEPRAPPPGAPGGLHHLPRLGAQAPAGARSRASPGAARRP